MKPKTNSVVIVGAGVAGLATALAFLEHTNKILIIDKRQAGAAYGNATSLQPRLFPALQKLGIFDTIKVLGYPLLGNLTYSNSVFQKCISFRNERDEYPLVFEQHVLEQSMSERLKDKGVSVCYNTEVINLCKENGGIALSLRINSREIRKETPEIIIAADGADSLLRQMLGINCDLYHYAEHSFVSDCTFDANFDTRYMQYCANDTSRLVIVPLPTKGKFKVSGATKERYNDQPKAIVAALFAESLCHTPDNLVVTNFRYYSMRRGVADRFHEKNVFLVGDSAHVFPPNGAQGLNMAIEDACEIGRLIEIYSSLTDVAFHYDLRRAAALSTLQSAVETKHYYKAESMRFIDALKEEERIRKQEL